MAEVSAKSRGRRQTPPDVGLTICFDAVLLKPKLDRPAGWLFLRLPREASDRLPSRGMVSVTGTMSEAALRATLEPDGEGGHWMKVPRAVRVAAGAEAGDRVRLELKPVEKEPEPAVPADFRAALRDAPERAKAAWKDTTPAARRDWVFWITSGKRAETREIRIEKACDMLAKGKRRPCCFDRSGMYGGGLSCPAVAD